MLLIAPSLANDPEVHQMAHKRGLDGDYLYFATPSTNEAELFEECVYDDLRVYFETTLPGMELCLASLVQQHALGEHPGIHVDLGWDAGTLYALYQLVKLKAAGKLPADLFIGVTVNRPGRIAGNARYWAAHPFLRRRLVLDALMLADEVFVTSKEACNTLFELYPKLERDISGIPSAFDADEEAAPVLASTEGG